MPAPSAPTVPLGQADVKDDEPSQRQGALSQRAGETRTSGDIRPYRRLAKRVSSWSR
ncbi:MAG: hypothetical protein QGF56_02760 [Verrucomicrobiota bacterium]|nr:hypothetical protein [Verrucomicrobiota bacterium]MDP6752582.1 hypothetical protein [Verrucomicrobiota bacterium]MDP7012935.1 hypothetical protein [Verrucomicrobiota bacterium]